VECCRIIERRRGFLADDLPVPLPTLLQRAEGPASKKPSDGVVLASIQREFGTSQMGTGPARLDGARFACHVCIECID